MKQKTYALLALLLLINSQTLAQTANPGSDNEISVTGDAPFAEAPNMFGFSALFLQTAATASEAASLLDNKTAQLSEKLRTLDPNIQIRPRGDRYLNSSGQTGVLKPGIAISVERAMAIETAELGKAAKILDTVMAAAPSQVEDILYAVSVSGKSNLNAVTLATERAKEKAALVAKNMGVTLGPLLSVVITEEPEGNLIRERMQRGENAAALGDLELRVYATVRYAVGNKTP